MTNTGIVANESVPAAVANNRRTGRRLQDRAAVPGPWVYVLTGDPELDNGNSPEWLNDFTFIDPVAFRHGLDGQTDMIGSYDLVTGGPVSGTIAFMMPNRWAQNVPQLSDFPVLLDDPGDIEDRVFGMAVQVVDPADPAATAGALPVRIYWPLWGQAL